MAGLKWLVIAELILDSGTEYVSGERVRRGVDIVYAGTVLGWGSIDKSIPSPAGMPQTSDAKIRIADPYRKWRDLLANQTPRRRLMQITLMPENASIADYDPVFIGEVVDAVFPPASIEITLRDRTFAWLDEPIPALVSSEFFDYVTPIDEGGFLPVIVGEMRSIVTVPATAQGVVPLPHMGLTVGSSPPQEFDRWGVAMHPVHDVVTVYRNEQVDVDGNREWVIVDPSEYEIVEEALTAYGNDLNVTFLDFFDEQPEGTQIRADVDGINARGPWGSLPDTGSAAVLQNPIDFFINITFFLLNKAGVSIQAFDTDDISALRTQFETLGYLCDGAITEPWTARETLSNFLTSFNLDMFVKKNGKITLNYTEDGDSGRPVFKEGKHILKESFMESLPEQISNLIVARYAYNNATGKFDAHEDLTIVDVSSMPDALSPETLDPKVEKEVLNLHFVRDVATLEAITELRNRALSLGSFRQVFSMPAPAVIDDLELGSLIGLTHSMGLDSPSGYVNKEVKVLGLTLDLDNYEITVRSILRVPQAIFRPVTPPPSLASLVLWLRADSLSASLDDGDAVASWADMSTYGNNAAQGTAANRPTFKTGIVAGRPVVRFDGVNDFLSIADHASLDITACHIFVVAKPTNITAIRTMVSKPYEATWIYPYARYILRFENGAPAKLEFWAADYTTGSLKSTNTPSLVSFGLYEGRYDGVTNENVYINEAAEGSLVTGQGPIPATARDLVIGTRNGSDLGEYMLGDIAEIMIYNTGTIAAADWFAIQDYLTAKYGL